jgi:mRNA-degrading endonuclease toxin of MazEF toxin-antitoxin module
MRGKRRPAVIIQSDAYLARIGTLVVAEITTNLTMSSDPACLLIQVDSDEGKATGILRDSVVSCLLLVTVYADTVTQVLGMLSAGMMLKLDACLRTGLSLA